ncbi:glycoside hydrolase family protein [Phenylobacterium sp. LjRoot164]|uniref:glycoside hydrolase family protein n=1 Tax=unclassified Phenylobacterium TaxID=2640670 RepID=UPI003ECE7951
MSNARIVAATLSAAAIAIGTIAAWEGKENWGYADKLAGNIPTGCFGATKGIEVGRYYSDDTCTEFLARDAVSHGIEISRCLPPVLPDRTRAAFISSAYNIGSSAFCKSSMARRANAGDLRGACEALRLYVWTGGKDCRIAANRCSGLPKRREAEVALCLSGLR